MGFQKGHPQSNTGRTHFKKGHIISEETRKKLSEASKGRPSATKGKSPWNKGLKGCFKHTEEWKLEASKRNKGKIISEKQKQQIRESKLGDKNPAKRPEVREKIRLANLGKKATAETRLRMSQSHAKGKKHPNWKGGITPINNKIRESIEYKLWRKSVFERDNYTCIWCKKRGKKIVADHIKPFALYPELRFAIDNGRTLCRECHLKTDTYGGRTK